MLDVLIQNGVVYSGRGDEPRQADVGIRGSSIRSLGTVDEKARRTIDATGCAVCPGFVDVHTHAEGITDYPSAENFLRQGITTVVSGNCGFSSLPVGEFLDHVEAAGPAIHLATLVGHGAIRSEVMGSANRKPAREELERMRSLARQAMREGAVGMSTGLFYTPGAYARLDELVALAEVVASFGGVYATHMRSCGGRIFEAIDEAAAIGKRAGIPVEVSHLKILHRQGRTSGDRVGRVLDAISRHRESGVDIGYDAYPYCASSTCLSAVAIPPEVLADGELKTRLGDETTRSEIEDAVAGNIAWNGGAENVRILSFPEQAEHEGKSLAEIAAACGRTAADAAMEILRTGDPRCMFLSLRQEDVDRIVCAPDAIVASDGTIVAPETKLSHPRNTGCFPRAIAEYVRARASLSMEEAIRRMTSAPARRFGLGGRGTIAEGGKADFVVFDPTAVSDVRSADGVAERPVGIRYVIVNGVPACEEGTYLGTHTGEVIRGSRAAAR